MKQSLNCRLDEYRLIEHYPGDQLPGNIEQMLNGVLDTIHNGDGVGVAALLEDRHVDRSLAVDAHQIGLDLLGVLGISDILYSHGGLPDSLQRQPVNVVDAA